MTERALAALAALSLSACVSCGHAGDAREIRRGVELVAEAAGVAAVRSLTAGEAEKLSTGLARVRDYADRFEEDARAHE